MDITANEPDGTMDKLKKENEKLKHILKFKYDNERLWNVMLSGVLCLFVGFIFVIFSIFAYVGASVVITEMHLSEFWISMISAFLRAGSRIVLIYILWHFIFVVYHNFQSEINEFFDKTNIRIVRAMHSFRKAYNEPMKEDE